MADVPRKRTAALDSEARRKESAFLAAALDNPKTLRRRLVLAIALAPPKARTRGRRRP